MIKKNHENDFDSQLEELLNEYTSQEISADIEKKISKLDSDHLLIEEENYTLVVNHQDAFDYEAFYQRYQDLFSKYDYIVGDWAFGQLRLRGFYQIGTPKVAADQRIEALEDYLHEYCNFGAKYFVLAQDKALSEYPLLTTRLKEGDFDYLNARNPMMGAPRSRSDKQTGRRRSNQSTSRKSRHSKKFNQTNSSNKRVKEDFQIKKNTAAQSNASLMGKKRKRQTSNQSKKNFVIKQKAPK